MANNQHIVPEVQYAVRGATILAAIGALEDNIPCRHVDVVSHVINLLISGMQPPEQMVPSPELRDLLEEQRNVPSRHKGAAQNTEVETHVQ